MKSVSSNNYWLFIDTICEQNLFIDITYENKK